MAGFSSWKKLGRFVKKGEHGLKILAPLLKRSPDAASTPEDDRSASSPSHILIGFRFVTVFDVRQTEGEDLPFATPLVTADHTVLMDLSKSDHF